MRLVTFALGAVMLGCGPAAKPTPQPPIQKPLEVVKERAGTALEHVPKVCAKGRFYFSVKTALAEPTLHKSVFAFRDRMLATATKGDWLELSKIHEGFKNAGIDVLADLHAIAICGSRRDPIIVVEGNFEGRDVLNVLMHAAEHVGEKFVLQGNGPAAWLEAPHAGVFTMLSPNVLAWAEKRGQLEPLRTPVDRAADWGIAPDDVLVGEIPKTEYDPHVLGKLRIDNAAFKLAMTVVLRKHDADDATVDPQKFEKKTRKELDEILDHLAKGPLAPVAAPLRKTKMTFVGSTVTVDAALPVANLAAALDALDANNVDTIF